MNRTFSLMAIVLVMGLQAHADDFQKNANPELLEKAFEGMHRLERPYEIGRSTFVLTVDCHATELDAQQAIGKMQARVQQQFDSTLAGIGARSSELMGYDISGSTYASAVSPISNTLDKQKKKYFWTNRCTGAQSATPVREANVYGATKTISIWLPNEGTTLNRLSALVTSVEALSETSSKGVQVSCQSARGSNYDLDVTDSTKKAAWEEIEKVAKRRANEKVRADFDATDYDNIWVGPETFTPDSRAELPYPQVYKQNGKWIGKFSSDRSFTVHYKQFTDAATGDKLVGSKDYYVSAEATTEQGLYGKLTIQISQGCQPSKRGAEERVSAVGAKILSQLRAINSGLNAESDRLQVGDASAQEYNPLLPYRQVENTSDVTYFYNPCTLETHELTTQPNVRAWMGIQTMTISSSKLDALSELKEELAKEYMLEIEDPNQLAVGLNWSATAVLDVLEALGSSLEREIAEKFLDSGSEFRCDAGRYRYSYACLATPTQKGGGAHFRAAPGGGDAEAAYSDKAMPDVDASERGVKVFVGSYTIRYTVRKVLIPEKD